MKITRYFRRIITKKEREEKEKSLESLINRYVKEEKKEIAKEKLEKIAEIIHETEDKIKKSIKEKVKVAKAQFKEKSKQLDQIKKAGLEYNTFTSKFRSAMPRTEEERLQDMNELKSAISILESLDDQTYRVSSKKFEAGIGIFYDKISRRFSSLINEYKLNEFKFIPFQRLKHHVFLNVKHIKDKDILEILTIMKDTHLLNDLIEINPTFYIIDFTTEPSNFSLADKVLLSLAYDENTLTIQKLMTLTEWNEDYARKIVHGLVDKKFATVKDDSISIEGFGRGEERRKWDSIIQKQIQKQQEKEREKHRLHQERKIQLEQQFSKVKEAKIPDAQPIDSLIEDTPPDINFSKKPTVKTLPSPKHEPQSSVSLKDVKLKETQEIKDKDALIGAMEALDGISPTEFKKTEVKKEDITDLDMDISLDHLPEEEQDLEDLISEKILNYHENFSLINGGLTQYEKIKEYMEQELRKDVPDDLIKTILRQLRELQMIYSLIKIGQYEFYLFNEISLNDKEKELIKFAINKKPLKKEDFINGLEWDEEETLTTMKTLQEKGILRIEKNDIIIPGIVQMK